MNAKIFLRNIATGSLFVSILMFGPGVLMASCSRSSLTDEPVIEPDRRDTGFNNGVYTAVGEYGNLPSHITVRITLDSGIIRDVLVTPHATDPTSLDLQRRFAAAVPEVVVGKHINDVNVGRLAGSSGTPRGFNDAVNKIKIQSRR